jgi:hypothetical protein
MLRRTLFACVASLLAIAPVSAAVTGHYVESRTCDVWTGPCFANADFNLTGKNAVMAWRVEKGNFNNVSLDGMGVAAVVSASDTLGLQQNGQSKVVLLVDQRASAAQREALIRMAQQQGGKLLANIVAVRAVPFDLSICECDGGGCAIVDAGGAFIKTRCLAGEHDKVCGNESAYYPPLAAGVDVRPAAATDHGYRGVGLPETWREHDRRGAYVGSFQIR